MNKLQILAAPILATLIGCSPQLKANPEIYSYYVTPGAGLYPTHLCGVSPSGEACLQMKDGRKVKAVINDYFLNWLPSLKSNETTIANSGRSSYILSAEFAAPLLQALVAGSKHREFERRRKRDDD
ncbi:MAG: hypothetical protein MJK10_19065 [Pseudomonadales bacterium]|nr:hypothetical protein [Pseudomonadales bacterium]NRA18388.1 hypothetical protein [Oceanospirillaceae bacterium]